jgi:hypothetical protein
MPGDMAKLVARLPGDERADLHRARFHSDLLAASNSPLEANLLPGYDSYARRLGFTIFDTLLRLLSDSAAGASAPVRASATPHPILLSSWLLARTWSYSKSPV